MPKAPKIRTTRPLPFNGFEYRAIPQEVQAYELAARYRNGGKAFSVRDEVARWFS